MVKNGNLDNFNDIVTGTEKLIMVDFWAPWCGPCKNLLPIIEQLSAENDENKVEIVKVNVDECPDLAISFGVRNIPCVIFIKNEKELKEYRVIGLNKKTKYQNVIDKLTE